VNPSPGGGQPLARVRSALEAAGSRKGAGQDWTCPAHDDRKASLSVTERRDGAVLLKCHAGAGCDTKDVVAALGLDMADLFPQREPRRARREIVATYPYLDERGELLFEAVRFSPKGFAQRRRPRGGDPSDKVRDGWVWSLGKTRRVLFRLPQVLAAVEAGQTVYVAEGERDVIALERAGVVATCNPMGAGKWRDEYAEALAGAAVVVIADRDQAGYAHARTVAASLERAGCAVRLVEPAVDREAADAADHLAAGYGLDAFVSFEEEEAAALEGSGEPQGGAPVEVATIRVADVKPEPVEWLWSGRIPRGMLTVFDGDPGLGKSTVSLDLTARATTGSPMPGETSRSAAANVVLLSAEDVVAQVIRPRLEAAGADCDRVVVVDHVNDGQGPRPPELPADVAVLEGVVRAEQAALVVVDPLMAFFGAEINAHRDQDVRRALHALKGLAERTGAAVLVIRHLNKAGGTNPLYRGGGSIGILGAARAGLLVAPDPEDDTRRILAASKANLAPLPASLAYRIVGDELYDTARIVWQGTSAHKAADLLQLPHDDPEAPARVEAEAFLRELLADGPMRTKDLQREARDAGIAWRTLERAKATLGVGADRIGKPGPKGDAAYYWALPVGGPTRGLPPRGGPTVEGVSAGQDDAGESGPSSSVSSANAWEGGGPTLSRDPERLFGDPDDPGRHTR
jgi:putative DNA primase/helicase